MRGRSEGGKASRRVEYRGLVANGGEGRARAKGMERGCVLGTEGRRMMPTHAPVLYLAKRRVTWSAEAAPSMNLTRLSTFLWGFRFGSRNFRIRRSSSHTSAMAGAPAERTPGVLLLVCFSCDPLAMK